MKDLNPFALYSELSADLDYLGPCERPSVAQSVESAAKYQILESFLKKYRDLTDLERRQADAAAISKFLGMNRRCRLWERSESISSFFGTELLGHLRVELHEFFNPGNGRTTLFPDFETIFPLSRVGPGVALGANGTDFYTKLFSSNLSYSKPFLLDLYHLYCRDSTLWREAEAFRSERYGHEVQDSCKVTTVPKNVDISRTIAIEPSLNIFFQLGIGGVVCDRLKTRFGIDVSLQAEVNRRLAREGSITGRFVTIDLESASDSMSRKMMRYVLDPFTFRVFDRYASSAATYVDPETGQPVREPLEMLSTMGNGFTFPLQTALFACIVSAARSYLGLRRERAGKSWSVFGDDIICDQRVAGPVIDLLETCGFILNQQKSFFQGPFRESCGQDFYSGLNVRGVYLKTLRTQQARYAVTNQLNRWSGRLGIPIPRTIQKLVSTVKWQPVPSWDNDDAGVQVPFSMVRESLPRSKRYQSIAYYRSESKPQKLIFAEGTVIAPRGGKRRVYNPDGILLAMLNGTLVSGKVSVRHNVNLYRRRLAIAPNWDVSSAVPVFATGAERQRWEIAVEVNVEWPVDRSQPHVVHEPSSEPLKEGTDRRAKPLIS
jgi:hypothetical protein